MFGNAGDVGSPRVTRIVSPRRPQSLLDLEVLAEEPTPAGFLPALAPRKRTFSTWGLRHGMFVDSTLFATSEHRRRLEARQERRQLRAAELKAQFDLEARRLHRLEAALACRQTERASKMAQRAAATLVQTRVRVHQASNELRWRERDFVGRFIADFLSYRLRRQRMRIAAVKIKRLLVAFVRCSAALRFRKATRAAKRIQCLWRGKACRAFCRARRIVVGVAATFVDSVVLYGFARAQQCFMGPHYAARTIQVRYRRRLRRRRAIERRSRRVAGRIPLRQGSHTAAKKISEAANALESKGTSDMPSTETLKTYMSMNGCQSMNPEGVSQLVKTAKFMATKITEPAPKVLEGSGSPTSLDNIAENDETFVTRSARGGTFRRRNPTPPATMTPRRGLALSSARRHVVASQARSSSS